MPVVESRLGDRLDLLASAYLQDPLKWEQITALNPQLDLTKGLFIEPGLLIEIPELVSEKIPDLLPWNDTIETALFEPEDMPIDTQPGANPNEILSGSGWLTPAQTRLLLEIPNYTFPLAVAEGGTGATTAAGARSAIGAVGFADLPDALLPQDIGIIIPPLIGGIIPGGYLPAYPTLSSLGGLSAAAVGVSVAPLVGGIVPSGNLPAPPTLTSLGGVSTATYTAGLALKLDTSTRSAANGVAPLGADSLVPSSFLPAYPTLTSLGGVSSATYTAGLATKLDSSARNAANGVAGLDANTLILAAQIPASVQFTLQPRSNTTAFNFDTLAVNHAALKWIDGSVTHSGIPSGQTSGAVFQLDPLNGISGATNLYKYQTFINYSNRVWDRSQSNGSWGTWNERAYLNRPQSFSSTQDFAASATFKGGSTPAITTTMVQAGVDSTGQPVLWLVNASATAGNRLKSITVTSNGNIKFTHYTDDGTAGNVFEHTASGNILTNGTVRPGSGNTAFTGAQFVPGSTYFQTNLLGDSGVGCLTYSDGSVWRRISDGTLTTEAARLYKTITGTTAATQGASVSVPHGLTGGKIVGWELKITQSANAGIKEHFTAIAGYDADCYHDATNFVVTNSNTNSSQILSKNFSIFITYTT